MKTKFKVGDTNLYCVCPENRSCKEMWKDCTIQEIDNDEDEITLTTSYKGSEA